MVAVQLSMFLFYYYHKWQFLSSIINIHHLSSIFLFLFARLLAGENYINTFIK